MEEQAAEKQAGVQDTPAEEQAARPKGGFVKGDPRINRAGRPPRPKVEPVPQQLADMRWVYEHPEEHDRTQGQKTCRAWMTGDVKGFMQAKTQLERQSLSRGGEESGEPGAWGGTGPCPTCKRPPKVVDEGTERALAIIDQLLGEDGP